MSGFTFAGQGGSALEVEVLMGEAPVPGCTDPEANNYDEAATADDGSCPYPEPACDAGEGAFGMDCPTLAVMFGCDFDTGAGPLSDMCPLTCDACPETGGPGCMDPEAVNYDPNATEADDNCLYCPDVNVCLGVGDAGELYYSTDTDIGGFQFETGGCATAISDEADAGANGFTTSMGGTGTVISFSFTGSVIPTGTGTLVAFDGDMSEDCFSDFVFSDIGGSPLTSGFASSTVPCDAEVDCAGECGGSADVDECGL